MIVWRLVCSFVLMTCIACSTPQKREQSPRAETRPKTSVSIPELSFDDALEKFKKAVATKSPFAPPNQIANFDALCAEMLGVVEQKLGTAKVVVARAAPCRLRISAGTTSPLNHFANDLVSQFGDVSLVYDLEFFRKNPFASARYDGQTRRFYLPHSAITDFEYKPMATMAELDQGDATIAHEVVHVFSDLHSRQGDLLPQHVTLRGPTFKPNALSLDEMNAYAHDVARSLNIISAQSPTDLEAGRALIASWQSPPGQMGSKGDAWLSALGTLESKLVFGGFHADPALPTLAACSDGLRKGKWRAHSSPYDETRMKVVVAPASAPSQGSTKGGALPDVCEVIMLNDDEITPQALKEKMQRQLERSTAYAKRHADFFETLKARVSSALKKSEGAKERFETMAAFARWPIDEDVTLSDSFHATAKLSGANAAAKPTVVTVEYCVPCAHYARALALKEKIRTASHGKARVVLVPTHGGRFIVRTDTRVFSAPGSDAKWESDDALARGVVESS